MFTTNYKEIEALIDAIDPIAYGKSRNYLNGAVTKLSPYISRGIISTKQVAKHVLSKGYMPYEIESFLKELAWRDYFQQVWIELKDDINKDIKQSQPNCKNNNISNSIVTATTGIEALDKEVVALRVNGYMHNHARMYVASMACNIAKSHWKMPAQWMYYYLLDADWASNALSWQWVAGSFSNKKYFANQENINRYSNSNQNNTFLDISYESFENIETPNELKNLVYMHLETKLPKIDSFVVDNNLPFYVYNFYNLDAKWDAKVKANRILLLEPSFFKKYPVCENTISFILNLSKNINHIQVFVGEFNDLFEDVDANSIHYKEHPTNKHYKGIEHNRDWMFDEVKGYFPSFFSYWKKCEKYLNKLHEESVRSYMPA